MNRLLNYKLIAFGYLVLLSTVFFSCSDTDKESSESNDSDKTEENVTTTTEEKQEPKPASKYDPTYKASMAGWTVGLDNVYEESQKTGKPILANFTGSDWCGWCIKLKADVFSKPKFTAWADKNVVLYLSLIHI